MPGSWLANAMSNRREAGAESEEVVKAIPFALIRNVAAGDPVTTGCGEAGELPKPSVGLNSMRYRIRSSPTEPMAAMVHGRRDPRIVSNCVADTAFEPPAMERATNPTRR